jgi:catalase
MASQGRPIAGSARPLGIAVVLLRLGAIGAAAFAAAAAFAYVGGWLSPRRLTQASILDAFARVDGAHAGFRRNHAKGVCVSGWFDSTGAATLLSKSEILEVGRVPVIGRFALAGGMPMQADTPSQTHPRRFAVWRCVFWSRTARNGEPA